MYVKQNMTVTGKCTVEQNTNDGLFSERVRRTLCVLLKSKMSWISLVFLEKEEIAILLLLAIPD